VPSIVFPYKLGRVQEVAFSGALPPKMACLSTLKAHLRVWALPGGKPLRALLSEPPVIYPFSFPFPGPSFLLVLIIEYGHSYMDQLVWISAPSATSFRSFLLISFRMISSSYESGTMLVCFCKASLCLCRKATGVSKSPWCTAMTWE
jgi:hypothetical protein